MEKKTNTGALFSRSPDVFKEGSLNINGTDYNIIVTKFKNKKGEQKFPVFMQIGWLNINTNKKNNDKQPDIRGNITFNTFKYNLGLWKVISKNNENYLSVSVSKDNYKTDTEKNKSVENENSDDPFA